MTNDPWGRSVDDVGPAAEGDAPVRPALKPGSASVVPGPPPSAATTAMVAAVARTAPPAPHSQGRRERPEVVRARIPSSP